MRPVTIRSSALASPTMRGRKYAVASSMVSPRCEKIDPMRALCAAMRKSKYSGIVNPIPAATPLIAQIGQQSRPAGPGGSAGRAARRRRFAGGSRPLADQRHVGAGAKRLAGAGENDRADILVIIGVGKRLAHLAAHRRSPGVVSLRPVEGDRRHPICFGENDLAVRHLVDLRTESAQATLGLAGPHCQIAHAAMLRPRPFANLRSAKPSGPAMEVFYGF